MRYRLMGNSGLRVSELFLGTMTFGEDWGWGAPPEMCGQLLTAFAEAGGNVIDTANSYTGGNSERIVGDLIGADRDHFVVSTKYTLSVDGEDPNASGNHRKSLVRSLERSLTSLKTGYVDVLWVHIWDPGTPVEETMRALDDVVRAGKVLYVGISDAPAWVVSRANALAELRGWTSFVGLQVPYSLAQRDIERELLPMARALELSVAGWSPLAGGVLSGKFTQGNTPEATRLRRADIDERDLRIARVVDEVAAELGCSSSQVALAWVMNQGSLLHPIIGARRLDQLVDNLGSVGLKLPADAAKKLDDVSSIDLGFPANFLSSTREFVYGSAGSKVDRTVRR